MESHCDALLLMVFNQCTKHHPHFQLTWLSYKVTSDKVIGQVFRKLYSYDNLNTIGKVVNLSFIGISLVPAQWSAGVYLMLA